MFTDGGPKRLGASAERRSTARRDGGGAPEQSARLATARAARDGSTWDALKKNLGVRANGSDTLGTT
jgi:hypothetical protein